MTTRKLTFSAVLVAIGVVLGNIVYIPIGVSKCFPIQHAINFISAISLGPVLGSLIGFTISLMRNILGTGSILAFPGSMIGALLAGLVYKRTRNKYMAGLGEIVGTGIIGGLVSFPLAKIFLGKEVLAFFFVYPFLISSASGVIVGILLDKTIDFKSVVDGDRTLRRV